VRRIARLSESIGLLSKDACGCGGINSAKEQSVELPVSCSSEPRTPAYNVSKINVIFFQLHTAYHVESKVTLSKLAPKQNQDGIRDIRACCLSMSFYLLPTSFWISVAAYV